MTALASNAAAPRLTSARATMLRRVLAGLGLLHLIFVQVQVHFLSQGELERDGYFHARLAYLLPVRWFSRQFRWTQFSSWKEHFCDKEFIFHLLMAPLARLASTPIAGAQIFMILLVVAVFIRFYSLLRAWRVPFPLFFAFALGAMGPVFFARLTMIRPHVLSLGLLLIGLHFIVRDKWKALAGLAFVYAWSYSVPFVLFLTALAWAAGQRFGGGPLSWRIPAAALGGAVVGLVLHPYSPDSILSVVAHLGVALQTSGPSASWLTTGTEILPATTWDFLTQEPLLALSFPALAALALRAPRPLKPETVGMLAAAGLWLLATMHSIRFVEYACPLMVAAWALVARDMLGPVDLSILSNRSWLTTGAVLAAMLAAAHAQSLLGLYSATDDSPPLQFQGAAKWMEANLGEGETVLNLAWADFPELFYSAPRQNYVWGIEPRLSLSSDPERIELLNAMITGKAPLSLHRLSAAFGTRYAVLSKRAAGPGNREPWAAYEDDFCWVLDMTRVLQAPAKPATP